MIQKCKNCGKEFIANRTRVNRGQSNYCSFPCYRISLRNTYGVNSDGSISIYLSNGDTALIDAMDYPKIREWRVCAVKRGPVTYATCNRSYLHRIVMGVDKGIAIDHINHNGLDNRRCNLRIATQGQNMCNIRTPSNNTSGFKGVSWAKRTNKWRAYIVKNNKQIHLGTFTDKKLAAFAYNEAAKRIYKEFACLNEIPDMGDVLIKVCCGCKKVLGTKPCSHSNAGYITHCLCGKCEKKLYPELAKKI